MHRQRLRPALLVGSLAALLASCGAGGKPQSVLAGLAAKDLFTADSIFKKLESVPTPSLDEEQFLSGSIAVYFTYLMSTTSDAPFAYDGSVIEGVRSSLAGMKAAAALATEDYASVNAMVADLGTAPKATISKTMISAGLSDMVQVYRSLPKRTGTTTGVHFTNSADNLLALDLLRALVLVDARHAAAETAGLGLVAFPCATCQSAASSDEAPSAASAAEAQAEYLGIGGGGGGGRGPINGFEWKCQLGDMHPPLEEGEVRSAFRPLAGTDNPSYGKGCGAGPGTKPSVKKAKGLSELLTNLGLGVRGARVSKRSSQASN